MTNPVACSPERNLGGAVQLLAARGNLQQSIIYPSAVRSQQPTGMSVSFTVGNPQFAAGYLINNHWAILARMTWGVGGGSMVAEFDVRNGTQVFITATSLSATVAFNSPTNFGGDPPDSVWVNAAVSLNAPSPSGSVVTRSYLPTNIVAGASQEYAVPPFTTKLNIHSPTSTFYQVGNAEVRFLSNFGTGTAYVINLSDGSPYIPSMYGDNGVIIPAWCRSIRITNVTVAPGTAFDVTPMFTLAL